MTTPSSPPACAEHKLSLPPPEADEKNQQVQRAENVQRAQWLRAAILGASDGLLSTTALMIGVGAAKDDHWSMILSGFAGTVAGSCSMAVGEFVSVSMQRDIEKAGRRRNFKSEKSGSLPSVTQEMSCSGAPRELPESPSPAGTPALTSYERSPMLRGIPEDVNAEKKEAKVDDDEGEILPNPFMAAVASSLSFVMGSLVPLATALLLRNSKIRAVMIAVVASISLALFGGVGAYLGGSPILVSAIRVLIGGCISMGIAYGLMKRFDDI
ncbi:vacuolar iron transporter homolog 2-like [Magnolia sinica]|uniref:vacuolar iron transporter homolog 2-like n=1 Tax=Magnolia sinica TaxID=86752 RepID=UPI00265A6C6F|nr:vacuolar iron transporter homolog 2-like [Magnolia sinica]